jgi:VWFA-related protein
MRINLFRGLVLGALIVTLMLPAGEMRALAQAKDKQQPPTQPPQTPGGFSISVTVPVVNVDAVVTDNNGNYLTGLKKENFRITEDGAAQAITNFAPSDSPITIVLLMEFSQLGFEFFTYNARNWSAAFLSNLKQDDWVALETFNMRSNVEVDFTHNPDAVMKALYQLVIPPFSESNLFDALSDVLDRMKDVKGRKAVLLLASGIDTFSKINLDQVIKRIRETDATIFAVGAGEQIFMRADAAGSLGPAARLSYLQAQNQLRTFAAMTGGRAWLPRFDGEIPGIMRDVAASLRSQYSMAYTPSNATLDGKYRKIKVELVNPATNEPLRITDEKGKPMKYKVIAKAGYTAPREVE